MKGIDTGHETGLLAFVDDRSPADILAALQRMPPSAFVLDVLMTIDRQALGGDDAISFLQVLQRVQSRLHAVQAEVLVAAASPERMVDEYLVLDPRPDHVEERTIRIEDSIREEIAAALRWSPATAQARVDAGRLLGRSLSRTREALLVGAITSQHAAVIVDAASRMQHGHAQLQDRVLSVARRSTVARTRHAANRAVLAIDADGQEARRRRARCTRDVFVVDEAEGISTLMARLASDRAHALLAAIDGVARAEDADPAATTGTIGERRAQALESMVLGSGTIGSGASGAASGGALRAHLDVVVGLDALMGRTDEPAHLAGSGSMSIDAVIDLLADPDLAVTVRRLLVDEASGHLLDLGRSTYRIPARLRAAIVARDRTCRFPGCARRASLCQVDHAVAWEDGGTTDRANLGSLSLRHHQLKTHGGWQIVASRQDGSCEWLSPLGRPHHREAMPVLERPPPGLGGC